MGSPPPGGEEDGDYDVLSFRPPNPLPPPLPESEFEEEEDNFDVEEGGGFEEALPPSYDLAIKWIEVEKETEEQQQQTTRYLPD